MAGRPTDYKEEFNEQVYKLCLLGATDKEIGDFFEVTEQTINNWKNSHPEFFESIKKGKVIADAEIAQSLYNRAKGFKQTTIKTRKNDEDELEEFTHEDYYPPDPTSMIYWLKNRRGRVNENEGQKWADKHEHVHDGGIPTKLIFESDPANQPIKDGKTNEGNTGVLGEPGGV